MQTNFFQIHTESSLIVMKWLGTVDTVDYRHAHLKFLEQIEDNNYLLCLLNYKDSEHITLEDHEWTLDEWLPKAVEILKNVQKIAMVIPENIFSKISMRILTTKLQIQRDLDMAFFRTEEEAKNWLIPEEETIAEGLND